MCRLNPWPEEVARTFAAIEEDPTVYATMNGPSEFHVVGTLRDWDITDRLGEIAVRTLLVSGRHDEATPRIVGEIRDRIPGAEWVLLEESSHMAHVEEPERSSRGHGVPRARRRALPISEARRRPRAAARRCRA